MNIFILDWDVQKCASCHVDRHVVKMPVETAQILSSVYYAAGCPELAPYKLTHLNHPCCVWARESLQNWLWLRELGLALCAEYTRRYGRTHKCEAVILGMAPPPLPENGITPVRYAFSAEYRVSDDPVENYRNYYRKAKRHLFTWKNSVPPDWINGNPAPDDGIKKPEPK